MSSDMSLSEVFESPGALEAGSSRSRCRSRLTWFDGFLGRAKGLKVKTLACLLFAGVLLLAAAAQTVAATEHDLSGSPYEVHGLTQLFSGSTVYTKLKTRRGSLGMMWKFKPAGEAEGSVTGPLGKVHRFEGKWWVENDKFCTEFESVIGGIEIEQGCYPIELKGSKVKAVRPDGKLAWEGTLSTPSATVAERPRDTELPIIRVEAPDEVDIGEGGFRISGLVGDDGSPPRLKVNGEPVPLFRPSADDPKIAEHTLAFNVEMSAREPGEQRVVVEACDASGNCVAEQVVVRVVGTPEETEMAEAQPTLQPAPEIQPIQKADEPELFTLDELVAKLEEKDLLKKDQDTELPVIRLSAPGAVEVGEKPFLIAGLVGDDGSPPRLKVNGEAAPLFNPRSGDVALAKYTMAFRLDLDVREVGEKRLVIEACDAAGNCIGEEVIIQVVVANQPSFKGRNYALIIGNDDYEYLPDLKTAVNDATALAELLKGDYAFEDDEVSLLINADRRTILNELIRLRDRLEFDDRLLLYYGGHGQIDYSADAGFWQPVDAEPDRDYTWISNDEIRRYLKGMAAKHVLVVADSCFSGTLIRAGSPYPNVDQDRFFAEIDSHISRKAITSGGTEPVADSGSGGHSVFAYYLLKALRENTQPYVTSFELFNGLVRAVTNNSDQKPSYGTVRGVGDEGAGDFTFIRRTKAGAG